MKRLTVLLCVPSLLLLVAGCGTGEAEAVVSCDECRGVEVCVTGEPGQLYCADPCIRNIDCALSFWCVPEEDEENYGTLEWVCMDQTFYHDLGRVWSWGDVDCSEGYGDECDPGMTCLVDDTGAYDRFFCSDSCMYDSDCLTDCCYDTGEGEYCAPESYCW